MSFNIKKGTADVTRYVLLADSADGTPETGYTITDLDLQYTRNRQGPAAKVDAAALVGQDAAHADNKAVEVDATSSPGLYRVDWPDVAFATGVDKVLLVVSGPGLHPAVEEIQLVDYDPEDGTRLGLTALPDAQADAAGGLPVSDAGGLDLDDLATKAASIETDTQDIQSRLPAALASGRMSSDMVAVSGDTTAADNLEASAEVIATGAAISGTLSTTQMTTDLTEDTDVHFKGRQLIWRTGALAKQGTGITAYNGSSKMLTFTEVTEAPSVADKFVIV